MRSYWKSWVTTVADFEEQSQKTTNVFSRNEEIEVTFTGEEPFVEKKVINFPSMDPTMELDNSTLATFRGFIDHETAMMRYTDQRLKLSVESIKKENGDLYSLFNVIEGIRVEQEFMQELPGSSKNLGALATQAWDTVLEEYKEEQKDFLEKKTVLDVFPAAIGIMGRVDYDNLYVYFEKKQIQNTLNKEDFDFLQEVADDVKYLESSVQSFDLANKIFKKYGSEKRTIKSKSLSLLAVESSLLKQEERSRNKTKYKWENPADAPPAPYRVVTTKYDRFHHYSDEKPTDAQLRESFQQNHWFGGSYIAAKGNLGDYKFLLEEFTSTVSVLRRKIELMIAAKRKVEWNFMKDRGKLDSKRLVQAYQGNPFIFKVKDDQSELDTAVSVVIDLSGSMTEIEDYSSERKIDIALKTAMVVSECLSKIGIPFEIIGFDCASALPNKKEKDWLNAEAVKNAHKMKYSRIEGIHLWGFKTFKDRMFDARKYMTSMATVGQHNNSDGESIAMCWQRLMKRNEKRKIMFVLSDGQPHCSGYNPKGQLIKLKETVAQIEKQGDIVGIGICTDVVKLFYSNYVVVKNPEDLIESMLNVLQDALLPEKKKKAVVTGEKIPSSPISLESKLNELEEEEDFEEEEDISW